MVGHEPDSAVTATLRSIASVTHVEPRTCPWRAYDVPEVQAILAAYRACGTPEGATPALLLPMDPPALIFHGCVFYKNCIDLLIADKRRREKEARDRNGRHQGH